MHKPSLKSNNKENTNASNSMHDRGYVNGTNFRKLPMHTASANNTHVQKSTCDTSGTALLWDHNYCAARKGAKLHKKTSNSKGSNKLHDKISKHDAQFSVVETGTSISEEIFCSADIKERIINNTLDMDSIVSLPEHFQTMNSVNMHPRHAAGQNRYK